MALHGTIKDFGLADILQLIGIQRKTGVLTLENADDRVTIKFLEGQVAGADNQRRKLEDQLGSVLVRTGRITEAQLQEVLETQKNTLQRLGYLLVHSNLVSEQELVDALQIQVMQIIFRMFRWRSGAYHFDQLENLDYDSDHFQLIPVDTILMEGARMIDEWPIIERRIKSDGIVFRKTAAGASLELPVESLVDEDIEFDFGFDSEDAAAEEPEDREEIKLSPDERQVLRIVDGRSTVQETVDRSPIGEFDVYRSLYELLTRNLIEVVEDTPLAAGAREAAKSAGLLVRAVTVVVLGFAFLALGTIDTNPITPWKLGAREGSTDRLRTYASRVRVERIEHAIRVFYLDTGSVPDRLDLLAGNGYLDRRDLLDPWGRPYGYDLSGGSFRLFGLDAGGEASEELTVSRTFSASQRMMLDGPARDP